MTDKKICYAVTFLTTNDHDGYVTRQIWDRFDADGIAQIFFRLDDAKAFIMDIVQNTLCDVPDSIHISNDTWDCYGDKLSIYGIGNGTTIPWLTMADCSGANVDFYIHQFSIH